MKELLFDVDSFNTPKSIDGVEAEAQLLLNILMCRKDTHITDGVAFEIRRFRFTDLQNSISTIETELREHCLKYLPGIYIDSLQTKARTDYSLMLVMNIIDTDTNVTRNIVFNVEDKKTYLLIDYLK